MSHPSIPNTLLEALFACRALRVAHENAPFWYTSGLFGPYYINTHYLFGSEAEAKALLQVIDQGLGDPSPAGRQQLMQDLYAACSAQYEKSPIYRLTIDQLCIAARKLGAEAISGGERRDFFFSIPVSQRLGLPHIALFKDGSAYHPDLPAGFKVLHIADLVTSASSYTRAWIPTLHKLGYNLDHTLVVVDRCQGGEAILADAKVELHALLRLEPSFFQDAQTSGQISEAQLGALSRYYQNPQGYVEHFLQEHPNFLEEEAQKDAKTAERVKRLRQLLDKAGE